MSNKTAGNHLSSRFYVSIADDFAILLIPRASGVAVAISGPSQAPLIVMIGEMKVKLDT
jgi:hypothetical protein